MYSLIAKNRRNSILFMAGFLLMFAGIGYLMYLYTGQIMSMVVTILSSAVYVFVMYAMQRQVAVRLTNSRPLRAGEAPNLESLVLSVSLAANMTPPQIHIIDTPVMNAFASGTKPEDSIIGFTTGLLSSLSKVELEGVIAHELSHIKNQDTRYKTVIFVLVSGIALIADIFLRMLLFSNNRNNLGAFALVPLIVIAVFLPISKLLQAAAGREREYYADISAVEMTRYPEGLASALEKISQGPGRGIRGVSTGASHLFIANPFAKTGQFMGQLLSTHPPTDKRVMRLRGQGSSFS